MSLSRSWQFIGRPGSWYDHLYDGLRRRVNGRLVDFLQFNTQCRGPSNNAQRQFGRIQALEAGSGTGFASSLIRQRWKAAEVVCLDIDADALVEARRRDPALRLVVGDLNCMPFRDRAFPLVFNNSTVEHLADPTAAVREMRRVCDLLGRVFVGVPYAQGPLWFQPLIRRTKLGVWLGAVFSRERLERMLRDAGLQPLHQIRFCCKVFIGALAAPVGIDQCNGGESAPC